MDLRVKLDSKIFTIYFDEEIKNFKEWTPEQKLDWLEKGNEFINKFVPKDNVEMEKSD